MLIVGAGSFAKELIGIVGQNVQLKGLAFYDDVNERIVNIFNKFPVLKNELQVKNHFGKFSSEFILGVGNPNIRYALCKKFENMGGQLTSCVSSFAEG